MAPQQLFIFFEYAADSCLSKILPEWEEVKDSIIIDKWVEDCG